MSLSISKLKMKTLLLLLLASLSLSSSSQPSLEDYQTNQLLENALLSDPYNLYILAQTFYPKIGSAPICQPVTFHLNCTTVDCQGCFNCTAPGSYDAAFLWTLYNVDQPIGPLLLSYANNGIVLRGFEWEDACLFLDQIDLTLTLNVTSLNQSGNVLQESLVLGALKDMTAVVRECCHHIIVFVA